MNGNLHVTCYTHDSCRWMTVSTPRSNRKQKRAPPVILVASASFLLIASLSILLMLIFIQYHLGRDNSARPSGALPLVISALTL
jgi:hypothetical protein